MRCETATVDCRMCLLGCTSEARKCLRRCFVFRCRFAMPLAHPTGQCYILVAKYVKPSLQIFFGILQFAIFRRLLTEPARQPQGSARSPRGSTSPSEHRRFRQRWRSTASTAHPGNQRKGKGVPEMSLQRSEKNWNPLPCYLSVAHWAIVMRLGPVAFRGQS